MKRSYIVGALVAATLGAPGLALFAAIFASPALGAELVNPTPVVSPAAPVTRASVRAQLAELEAAGLQPGGYVRIPGEPAACAAAGRTPSCRGRGGAFKQRWLGRLILPAREDPVR